MSMSVNNNSAAARTGATASPTTTQPTAPAAAQPAATPAASSGSSSLLSGLESTFNSAKNTLESLFKSATSSWGSSTTPTQPTASNPATSPTYSQPAPTTAAPQATAPVQPATPKNVQLNVPWFSQFKSGNGFTPGDTACFKASVAMAKAGGATVLGPDERIQIGKAENSQGRLTSIDSAAAKQGRAYIDRELEAGRPVVVGVSSKDKDYNVDKLTDHFVTITGRGTDEQGRTFYNYNEPGTSHQSKSTGRLYVDDKTGNLYADIGSKHYDVAMVRKNAENPSVPGTAPAPGRTTPSSADQARNEMYIPPKPSTTTTTKPATGALAESIAAGGTVRKNSSGPAVEDMQARLKALGYNVSVDGKFGANTEAAVKQFQRDHGLKQDGVFGAKSLAALQAELG